MNVRQALHCNFSSIFTLSETLPLLCSSTPLFPTPFLVSPKFPHVSLAVGGRLLGYALHRAVKMIPVVLEYDDGFSATLLFMQSYC